MGLKNNKKEFDWRTMLKCMVCRFLYIHTNKISNYTIVMKIDTDYNKCINTASILYRKNDYYG